MNKINEWLAINVTKIVGTMYCAYLFAVIGILGVFGAFTGNVQVVLIVGAISGYFLQLVLLPIIMVGQSVHHKAQMEHISKIHQHLGIK